MTSLDPNDPQPAQIFVPTSLAYRVSPYGGVDASYRRCVRVHGPGLTSRSPSPDSPAAGKRRRRGFKQRRSDQV